MHKLENKDLKEGDNYNKRENQFKDNIVNVKDFERHSM